MKTLFRVLSLAILLTAFSVLTFAQDKPDLGELFTKFRTEIKAPCGQRDPAMVTGKTIIDNYGTDELNKEVIEFVKKKMAEIEKTDPRCKLEARYNAAYKAANWSEFLDVSKQIMTLEGDTPLGLDILLTHVSVGYDRAAVDKIDTYNNDTLSFAKTALQRIDAGKTSKTGKYGVYIPFNTKEAAQSWMNYIIGWEMYYKMNQQKDALGYLYKATQVSAEKKNDTTIYTNIGKYYFDEAVRLDGEYRTKRQANNNEDNDETKALIALARGTADRAADAFGRAYKIAAADPKLATLKTNIGKTLTELYKFRFNLADAKQPDVDKYIADLVAKPMPDPATAVTPVVEEVKPTTTTSTTPSTSTTPTTPTTKATTTTTKQPTSSTTNETPASTTTSTTKAATPVKKPVTKKKGTR